MRLTLIGPTYPYRGGIAHYTTLLYQALAEQHETQFISFKRQYPSWLFPGQSDRDSSAKPLQVECRYLLDPLNPWSWRQTAQAMGQHQPAGLVMGWWHPYWSFVSLYLTEQARRQGAKRLYVVHNVLSHEAKFWDRWLSRAVLNRADGLIVHSSEEAKRLQPLVADVPIRVVPHPTYQPLSQQSDPTAPPLRAELGISPEVPLLLFFGFVRPYKGLPMLLQAMAELSLKAHLLVVGEAWGETAQETQRQLTALNLHDRVTVINQYVPNEAIGRYFSAADVVMVPYRRASGSGIVQLAYGFQKPVIATKIGGLAEVVSEGETGLLTPPDDPAALARTIERFFTAYPQHEWGAQIIQHSKKFSWQTMSQQITEMVS